MEILLASAGLVASSPLLVLGAVLIRFTSPGPVFFRQKRVGRYGKLFELIKFRSMRIENEGSQITAKGDKRVTWAGKLLRITKIDELPELWNVVRGDLSLVGPRPEVPKYVDLEDPLWRRVLKARPGITDPVTLRLRNEEVLLGRQSDPEAFYLQTLQPYKLRGYLEYLDRRTAASDFRVIRDTVMAVVAPARTPPPSVDEILKTLNELVDGKKTKNDSSKKTI
jgi:lipopolysaccharide/colanic/teichoic acid biosynthesis glycosyltransferase